MTKNYMAVISKEVRILCATKQLTQTDIAKVLGLSQSAISMRFTGRSPWSLTDLVTLHDTFGVVFPIGIFTTKEV